MVLAIDGPWLGPRGIETFLDELSSADRDVALVLAASFDPLDTFDRIAGLRRVLQWAVVSGRQLEDLRTDLTGIAAATEGASLAAVGLGTSTRHFCLGLGNRSQRQYADRQRSPLVFVPRLLHWQRANVLGALGPWQGAGLTDCDCQVCSASGDDLQRFDVPSTTEVREQVRAHDAHALGSLVRDLSRVDDAASELKQWRGSAVDRARSVQARTKVRLPMPAWMTSWD